MHNLSKLREAIMAQNSKNQRIIETYGYLTPLEMAETFSTTLAYVNQVLRQAGATRRPLETRTEQAGRRSR